MCIRKQTSALLVAGSLMALVGCSADSSAGDSKEPSSSTSAASPSPSRTTASPTADPGAAIEAAYRSYWDEKVKAYANGSVQGTQLKKFAVAEAYAEAEAEVKALKTKGLVATGQPTLAPQVTSVDTDQRVPRGALTDCADVSDWKLVQQSDGKEVELPEERLTKYVVKAAAEKWYGRWVIVKVTPQDKAC
ncbi:hypothetical protein GCM10010377_76030 [Streptomyces viridiviolaceus]|uniref:Secreted protein/lipoprotein n=1 Tax=Streptomyces viridiviolaceus TaxID=68282 RepID=A0ABW2DZL0_9ACTN|nr:hypothetical protein [Streptomyces viridiviolaceus]GHB74394.1 hypothetical protein GCM10010377_76030 [Streptomyces viridiviolaceus]